MTDTGEPKAFSAVRRPIEVGQTVGGTSSGRYQDTMVGRVEKIGARNRVRLMVTQSSRFNVGKSVWIDADRVFHVWPVDPSATS